MSTILSKLFSKKSPPSPSPEKAGGFSAPASETEDRMQVEGQNIAGSQKGSAAHLETPQMLVGIAQSKGIQRESNEDSLFTLTSTLNINGEIKNFGIYIIADGMGGHDNGDVASRIAVEKMSSHLINKLFMPLISDDENHVDSSIQEVMREGVVKAHQTIKHAARGGGTTLTAALVLGDQLTIAHVGDSRAYLVEPDLRMSLLTHDHSIVKRLEEIGQLTGDEASKNLKRNLLYRAVGQGDQIDPDITSYHIFPGQMLVMCTDGLWGVVPDNHMVQVIDESRIPQFVCQTLVDAANMAGGPDNISVIMVNFPG